jgi:hypothetical protein
MPPRTRAAAAKDGAGGAADGGGGDNNETPPGTKRTMEASTPPPVEGGVAPLSPAAAAAAAIAAAPAASAAERERQTRALEIVLENLWVRARAARMAARQGSAGGAFDVADADDDGEDGATAGGGGCCWEQVGLDDRSSEDNSDEYCFSDEPGPGASKDAMEVESKGEGNDGLGAGGNGGNENDGGGGNAEEEDEDDEEDDDNDDDRYCHGRGKDIFDEDPARPEPSPAARDFFTTCVAASRTCRDWRLAASGAADVAAVYLVEEHESAGKRSRQLQRQKQQRQQQQRQQQQQQRGPPRDPLSALAPFVAPVGRRSALRALWLRGALPEPRRLRSLARALGVVEAGTCRLHPGDAALADLLRGLRVLRISYPWPIAYALSGVKLCRPPPHPPILSNLVALRLHAYESRWSAPPPSGRAAAARRPAGWFTRQHLPSLRNLDVSLLEASDCPLDLVGAAGAGGAGGLDDDGDDALLPPPLTRLRVMAHANTAPPPSPFKRKPGRWSFGEPLLVSLRSLRALAPSLRVLAVQETEAGTRTAFSAAAPARGGYGEPPPSSATTAAAGALAAAAAMPFASPGPAEHLDRQLRTWRSEQPPAAGMRPPPDHLRPMQRLARGLGPCTRLAALRLDCPWDFWPENTYETPTGGGGMEAMVEQHLRFHARLREWQAASRAVLAPLAPSIVELRLSLHGSMHDVDLSNLPDGLSVLTCLTRLEVSARRLVSVGRGLRQMHHLRSLSIRALSYTYQKNRYADQHDDEYSDLSDHDDDDDDEYTHPPVAGRDLTALTRLSSLELSHAALCIAEPIERALPALRVLTLTARHGCSCGRLDHRLRDPPRCVLGAALARMQQQPAGTDDAFKVRLAETPSFFHDVSDCWPEPREMSEAAIRTMVRRHRGDSARRIRWHDEVHEGMEEAEADAVWGAGASDGDDTEAA